MVFTPFFYYSSCTFRNCDIFQCCINIGANIQIFNRPIVQCLSYMVDQINLFTVLHYTPLRYYGVSIDGFSNPLTSTNINTILSIFTFFRFINTRDLIAHYVFQVEVNMNCRQLVSISQ